MLNWYTVNFSMVHVYGWDFEALENMLPFERTAYCTLQSNHIQEQDIIKQQMQQQNRRR